MRLTLSHVNTNQMGPHIVWMSADNLPKITQKLFPHVVKTVEKGEE